MKRLPITLSLVAAISGANILAEEPVALPFVPAQSLIRQPQLLVEIGRVKGVESPVILTYYNKGDFSEKEIIDLSSANDLKKRSLFVWKEGSGGQSYTIAGGDVLIPEKSGMTFLVSRDVLLKYLEGCLEINWDRWTPLVAEDWGQ